MVDFNEIILGDKINYVEQIEGFGETANVEEIKVDVSSVINRSINGSFKLELTLKIRGYEYNYSNIYVNSDVPNDGILTVGNVGIVGNINQSEIEIKAIITNINNP